ncbi:MAG: hypothetical protein Q9211_006492, partial [Gyalolechia sp. 1 TL-2023]
MDEHQIELPPAVEANGDHAEDTTDDGLEEQANGIETSKPINTQTDAQPTGTRPNGGYSQEPPSSGQQSARTEEASIDPTESLEPFAWDDLEDRFLKKMEECARKEEEIEKEFGEWCLVFRAWASTTREHEEERAQKR